MAQKQNLYFSYNYNIFNKLNSTCTQVLFFICTNVLFLNYNKHFCASQI